MTVEKFCKANGIMHETINPYRPEQNGIAECTIIVLMEMTRSTLYAAHMDLQYWGEAFMYVTYIRLIMLNLALSGKIPFTEWSNSHENPDVSHLCVFGSFGWAHVSKEVRHGKLEFHVVRVHILG